MIILCVPLAGVPVWYDSTSSCIISNCPRYSLPMPLLRVWLLCICLCLCFVSGLGVTCGPHWGVWSWCALVVIGRW